MNNPIRNAVRLWKAKRPWRPKTAVTVVSPGGVATGALMRYLSELISVNKVDDSDTLKHRPYSPAEISPEQSLLFITVRPSDSRASIERRGWLHLQSAKLGTTTGAFMPKSYAKDAFESAVSAQLLRYQRFAQSHPDQVKIITYEEIWSNTQAIADFLDIQDSRFIKEFPTKRARLSCV